MAYFKKSVSQDGTARAWSHYPHTVMLFETVRGIGWKHGWYHHARLPVIVGFIWMDWCLHLYARSNSRMLFSVIV